MDGERNNNPMTTTYSLSKDPSAERLSLTKNHSTSGAIGIQITKNPGFPKGNLTKSLGGTLVYIELAGSVIVSEAMLDPSDLSVIIDPIGGATITEP